MPSHKQLTAVISIQLLLFGVDTVVRLATGYDSRFSVYKAKRTTEMNEFEKRMNGLRRQFAAERAQISKDCYRTIGRLNTAIGKVDSIEARDALRAEKQRIYEAMRTSHRYNRLCYLQQLEAIEDEYNIHLERNPSKRQVRRMMAAICRFVDSAGAQSYTVALDGNRQATITFG